MSRIGNREHREGAALTLTPHPGPPPQGGRGSEVVSPTQVGRRAELSPPPLWGRVGWGVLRARPLSQALAPALIAFAAFVFCPPARADDAIQYNRDVRPILNENCFSCHGADSAARKADLRLDRRDDAIKAEAIVPGDPDNSEFLARVFSDDADEIMPPKSSKKTLTLAQKELLKRWVATGAEYQPHWSFIAPKRPTPPQ